MDFESDFRKKNEAISLSSAERQKSAVLILDAESNIRLALRQSLIGLGYGTVSDAADQSQALQKIEERHFTHLLFDARQNRPAAKEFLHRVFEMDEELIVIATSYEPTVDDVFDLLICGCRGYLMKPFTTQSLDDALVLSTKGERISEAILHAKNRNEALALLAMSSLDKLANIMRQAMSFETARREVPSKSMVFRRSIDLAHTFAKGGPIMFRETLMDMCIERSKGSATRIGRFRRRAESKKQKSRETIEEKLTAAIADSTD